MDNHTITIGGEVPKGADIVYRRAVRCVSKNPGGILMVRTNAGNYKFPGGGVEEGEDDETALRREVLEETGYLVIQVKRVLFKTVQRNTDYKDKSGFFVMESIFMECEVDVSLSFDQRLSAHEQELRLMPVIVPIKKALEENEKIGTAYPSLEREILALRKVLESYTAKGT